jgi:hypothetical protein
MKCFFSSVHTWQQAALTASKQQERVSVQDRSYSLCVAWIGLYSTVLSFQGRSTIQRRALLEYQKVGAMEGHLRGCLLLLWTQFLLNLIKQQQIT